MSLRRSLLIVSALVAAVAPAAAQNSSPPASAAPSSAAGWTFTIYPVLGWVPSGVDIDVNIPPIGDGGGGDAGFTGSIVDPRFDGAFLGGFSATNGAWRIDADGVWAGVGGDRPQLPKLTIDANVIYFHVSGGRRIAGDLFVTGGVRRLALKYDILVADRYQFERKPGVWDPLVGIGWHSIREKWEVHGLAEGGGFGLTGGYQWLYFKVEDDVRARPITVKQTLQGPVAGIGFYF